MGVEVGVTVCVAVREGVTVGDGVAAMRNAIEETCCTLALCPVDVTTPYTHEYVPAINGRVTVNVFVPSSKLAFAIVFRAWELVCPDSTTPTKAAAMNGSARMALAATSTSMLTELPGAHGVTTHGVAEAVFATIVNPAGCTLIVVEATTPVPWPPMRYSCISTDVMVTSCGHCERYEF